MSDFRNFLPPCTDSELSLQPFAKFEPDELLPSPRLQVDFRRIIQQYPFYRKVRKDSYSVFRAMGYYFVENLLKRQLQADYQQQKEQLFKKVQEEDLVLVTQSTLITDMHKYLDKGVLLKSFSRYFESLQRVTYNKSPSQLSLALSQEFNNPEGKLEALITLLFRCLALTAVRKHGCMFGFLSNNRQPEPAVILAVAQYLNENLIFFNNMVELNVGSSKPSTAIFYWKDNYALVYSQQTVTHKFAPTLRFQANKRIIPIPVIPLEQSQFQFILTQKSVESGRFSNRSSKSNRKSVGQETPTRLIEPKDPFALSAYTPFKHLSQSTDKKRVSVGSQYKPRDIFSGKGIKRVKSKSIQVQPINMSRNKQPLNRPVRWADIYQSEASSISHSTSKRNKVTQLPPLRFFTPHKTPQFFMPHFGKDVQKVSFRQRSSASSRDSWYEQLLKNNRRSPERNRPLIFNSFFKRPIRLKQFYDSTSRSKSRTPSPTRYQRIERRSPQRVRAFVNFKYRACSPIGQMRPRRFV